ncbi:MAG: sensor histidine kinase [Chloroflexota bacterium]
MLASILIVEDDVALREGVREILEAANYQVSEASDGQEALDMLDSVKPDLIVSDIMMPQMDGYSFYRHVRQDDRWLQVPFIFLTARGEKTDILLGKSMGVDDYLTKPFDPEELLVAVESKLNRMKQLAETTRTQLENLSSQLETLSEQLALSNRFATIGELVAEIVHEIKNPLTAITAYAQFVQRRMARKEPETAQDMERIVRQAKRIAKMAEDILGYTRKEPLEIQATDVHHLIEEVVAFISFRLTKSGIEVETHFDAAVPTMLIDPDQMEQVFLNIIINAIHAMKQGGTLTITTDHLTEDNVALVRISFTDTGVGIPEENKPRLFEPYFTTRPPGQGTGLGLHVCQNIVHKHNGRIEVESQVGQGATFHILLPVAERKPTGPVATP